MKKMNKLTLALLLSIGVFNAPQLNAACSVTETCLDQIDDSNTAIETNNASILTELQDNFDYGPDSFNTATTGSSLNSYIYASSYLATRFFLLDLALPVFSQSTLSSADFNIAIEGASDFSTNLNTIHDIDTTLLLSNFFYTQLNNGYNPIENLDISPYVYPRASQVIRNSIGSVPPIIFLNKVIADNVNNNYSIPMSNYCPSRLATYSLLTDTNACIQPFEQLATAGGYGFPLNPNRYVDQNQDHTFNVTAPEYWDFLDQNLSPLVLPSLSADTLMNSLTYEDSNTNTSNTLPADTKFGLYGRTELASADNFIRYISGELLPNVMSTSAEYQQYYKIATQSTCYPHRLDASMKINAYRTMLRTYAAQASVGTSNLYHIMHKRRPVTVPGTTLTQTSQLEQEYKMATFRLFNTSSTSSSTTTDWQEKLATASSGEIQRQMAILLAEINYQLFLNRKEQERILLTLSAMQLGNNTQAKKQLTITEAASYVSPMQIPTLSTESTCQSTQLENSE